MAYIIKIDNKLRDSLKETLDRNGSTLKRRPYYYGVSYKSKMILIPLRSNCPHSSYSLRIYNLNKPNSGMDFCKMIILDKSEFSNLTEKSFVEYKTMKDIYRKKEIINQLVFKTICDYKRMINKKKYKIDLTKEESYLNKRSTLVNYIDFIMDENSFKLT